MTDSVAYALSGLTKVQRMYVDHGCIHGDCTMRTVRALKRKGMFALTISSPNGQCGFMELTPLGLSVQRLIKSRAVARQSKDASQ